MITWYYILVFVPRTGRFERVCRGQVCYTEKGKQYDYNRRTAETFDVGSCKVIDEFVREVKERCGGKNYNQYLFNRYEYEDEIISPHRDNDKGLVPGSDILSIALYEKGPEHFVFGLISEKYKTKSYIQHEQGHGLSLSQAVNEDYMHEVAQVKKLRKKNVTRISATMRNYQEQVVRSQYARIKLEKSFTVKKPQGQRTATVIYRDNSTIEVRCIQYRNEKERKWVDKIKKSDVTYLEQVENWAILRNMKTKHLRGLRGSGKTRQRIRKMFKTHHCCELGNQTIKQQLSWEK